MVPGTLGGSEAVPRRPESSLQRLTGPGSVAGVDTGRGTYVATVGSQAVELPVVALGDDMAIALLICVDHGIGFTERAGAELAAAVAPFEPDLVVSVATMGIPLAIEVTRSLGLDDYLILHKTPKIHLGDSLAEPLTSITTDGRQYLRMDPARVGAVAGHRVAVVDDVISTGGSIKAALALLRRVGAEPVVIGTLVTEGSGWSSALGPDAHLVRPLGAIPVFRPGPRGTRVEDWGA
jgi:adenine/guanine phosphoribosyltransferase-like PRPP-binding protein